MDVQGYMVRVSYDGQTLTAEGTNKASQVALAGQDHAAGRVVLTRAEIERVEFKGASALTNGRLTVHSTEGRKYVLHFRRKQTDGFSELAQALGANV